MTNSEKIRVLKAVFQIVKDTGNPLGDRTDEHIEGMLTTSAPVWLLFLYDHSFAQSLFGVANRKSWHRFGERMEPEYIYRLKSMVVYPDPLEYLAKYLKERKADG